MQLANLNLGEGDPKWIALSNLRAIGIGALPMAEGQITKFSDRPDLVDRWFSIVASIRAIIEVDNHMPIALDLLDTLDLTITAATLDAAINEFGLRSPEVPSFLSNAMTRLRVQPIIAIAPTCTYSSRAGI